VCECFEFGFPPQWLKLLYPNMEQQNEQSESESESTANAPRHSVEYYMKKLSMGYDFYSSTGCTSNTDGPATQSLSDLPDGNAGNMAASLGLYGGTRNMPEKPLTPPGETCCRGQESEQHERMQIDVSEQGIVNRSVSSVSVNLSTGSICPNSKVDESILVPSKIVPVEKEGYRSRSDCCQAEDAADIPENTLSCSSEQEMATLPIDSAIVNENLNSTSSDLGEPGTPKCGKVSVNLRTTDALELTNENMTPQFGAVRGSEESTVRRLRSGKVFGTPSGGPVKRRYKKKSIQHEASSEMMAPKEGGTSTDLTSHENPPCAIHKGKHERPICHQYGHWYTCKAGDREDFAAMLADRGPRKKKVAPAATETSIGPVTNPGMVFPQLSSTGTTSTTVNKRKKKSTSSTTSSRPSAVSVSSRIGSNQLELVPMTISKPTEELSAPAEKKQRQKKSASSQAIGSLATSTRSILAASPSIPAMGTRSKRKLAVT